MPTKIHNDEKTKIDGRSAYHPIPLFDKDVNGMVRHGDAFLRYMHLKNKFTIINNTSKLAYIIIYPYRLTEFTGCLGGFSNTSIGINTRGLGSYRKTGILIPGGYFQNIYPASFKSYISIFLQINDDPDISGGNPDIRGGKYWKPYVLNFCCSSSHDFYIQKNMEDIITYNIGIDKCDWQELGNYVEVGSDFNFTNQQNNVQTNTS